LVWEIIVKLFANVLTGKPDSDNDKSANVPEHHGEEQGEERQSSRRISQNDFSELAAIFILREGSSKERRKKISIVGSDE